MENIVIYIRKISYFHCPGSKNREIKFGNAYIYMYEHLSRMLPPLNMLGEMEMNSIFLGISTLNYNSLD